MPMFIVEKNMKKINQYKVKINQSDKKIRKPGMLKDRICIKKDFDELPEEFMEHFK